MNGRREPVAMPHSLEAEQAVLGGILLENGAIARVTALITQADFYANNNALIFDAMIDLARRGDPIDPVTLRTWLTDRDAFKRAGGDEHLGSLGNLVPTVANIEEHAKIIREKATLRRVSEAGRRIHLSASSGDIAAAITDLTTAQRQAAQIAGTKPASQFDSFKTLAQWGVDVDVCPPDPRWLFQRIEEDLETGSGLHEWKGVMECGTVAMLPGMPGLGKSTIKLWCAVAIATGTRWLGWKCATKGRVVFATAEEAFGQVHRRLYRLVQHLQLTDEQRSDLYENLVIWPLRGDACGLIGGRELNYAPTRFCEELLDRVTTSPVTAMIFDPLSRFASPDVEVDNYAGTSFVSQLERFSMLPSTPTVIFTHHTTKSGAEAEDDMFAARGSSSLSGGVKWQANLTTIKGPENDPRWGVKVSVTKSNWAQAAPKVWLRWDRGVLRVAEGSEIAQLKAILKKQRAGTEDAF